MRYRYLLTAAIACMAFLGVAVRAEAAGCASGTLIRGSLSAVYYCGADGKRYVFTNDKAYLTWYPDFSGVKKIPDGALASIMIGGNATYRPGAKMIKIQSDPRTYVVTRGGVLHAIASEAVAACLYGPSWNKRIDDVSDALFVDYKLGADIVACADYDRAEETGLSPTINADRDLPSTAFDAGMVSLDFDDGFESVYQDAIPLLDKAGFKSTQYVITQYFDQPDRVDRTQAEAMRASGHEIGAHSRVHPHLSALPHDAMVAEVAGSKSDLAALGMDPATFAYPYGDYDAEVEQAVKDAGYRGARSVEEGFNDKKTDPFALADQHVNLDVTIGQVKGWIDQAMQDKTWLILELHRVDRSGLKLSTTPEFLQQIITYIQSTGIQVVTNDQGLAAMGY